MIYQVRSFSTLNFSKRYLKSREEVRLHVKEVVRLSNEFRKNPGAHSGEISSWGATVTDEQIRTGIEILVIDDFKLPNWTDLFGKEVEISLPYFSKKN